MSQNSPNPPLKSQISPLFLFGSNNSVSEVTNWVKNGEFRAKMAENGEKTAETGENGAKMAQKITQNATISQNSAKNTQKSVKNTENGPKNTENGPKNTENALQNPENASKTGENDDPRSAKRDLIDPSATVNELLKHFWRAVPAKKGRDFSGLNRLGNGVRRLHEKYLERVCVFFVEKWLF
jgi:hypothetical protein